MKKQDRSELNKTDMKLDSFIKNDMRVFFGGTFEKFNNLPDDFKERIGKWVPSVSPRDILLKFDYIQHRNKPYLVVSDEYQIALVYEKDMILLYQDLD